MTAKKTINRNLPILNQGDVCPTELVVLKEVVIRVFLSGKLVSASGNVG